MRPLLIIYVASMLYSGADGKTTASKINMVNQNTGFRSAGNEFSIYNDRMSFLQLPKNSMEYYIVGQNGGTEQSGTISRIKNTLNLGSLTQGCHTIILKQSNDVRVYGYCSPVTVKARRK